MDEEYMREGMTDGVCDVEGDGWMGNEKIEERRVKMVRVYELMD